MPDYTSELNLKKPFQTEHYNVEDFNGNFETIDSAFVSAKQEIAEAQSAAATAQSTANTAKTAAATAQSTADTAKTAAATAQSAANAAQATANTKQTAPTAGQSVKYGANALATNTGANNTAIGDNAGRYTISGGANNASSSSVYIGDNTDAEASGDENEIVIGHNTEGHGSDTATLGNSLVTEFFCGSCVEIDGSNVSIGKNVNVNPNKVSSVVIGNEAAKNLTSGSGVVVGADCGYASAGGSVATNFDKVVYVGQNCRPSAASGNINEIIIGYNAVGQGSNTAHIGSSSLLNISYGAGTGTAFVTRSDRRTKEDIQDANLDICYADIKSLALHRFKYKDFVGNEGDQHLTGFVADEFEKVFPKAVFKNDHSFPLLDENGNKVMKTVTDEDGVAKQVEETQVIENCASIDTSQIVPTLMGAVQKLMAKVESLEAEIAALKAQ